MDVPPGERRDREGRGLSHLSLLQSSLELQLLGIQLLPDLLQLVDGLVAGAELLREVRDLLCPGETPSDPTGTGGERPGGGTERPVVSPWRFLFSLLKVSRCSRASS